MKFAITAVFAALAASVAAMPVDSPAPEVKASAGIYRREEASAEEQAMTAVTQEAQDAQISEEDQSKAMSYFKDNSGGMSGGYDEYVKQVKAYYCAIGYCSLCEFPTWTCPDVDNTDDDDDDAYEQWVQLWEQYYFTVYGFYWRQHYPYYWWASADPKPVGPSKKKDDPKPVGKPKKKDDPKPTRKCVYDFTKNKVTCSV